MNIMQRIQSALKRPLGSLSGSVKEDEENLLLEHDPVGAFLENKKLGVNPAEDEAGDAAVATGVPSQDAKQAVEASSEIAVSPETVERAAVQPAESRLESPVRSDSKVETPVTELPECTKEEAGQVEGGVSEAPSETKAESPALESVGREIAAANMPSIDSPQEDEKIESVLDVFRSEELALDTTSTLSKELSDTNVYSLLEESKHIARIAKKVKKGCPE